MLYKSPWKGFMFDHFADEAVPKPKQFQHDEVKDARGRAQRFHGAFTGGFSAGFFNSVGSKEGQCEDTINQQTLADGRSKLLTKWTSIGPLGPFQYKDHVSRVYGFIGLPLLSIKIRQSKDGVKIRQSQDAVIFKMRFPPLVRQHFCRDHFVNLPNQREMKLHCNVVSHWLGAYTKWSLFCIETSH